MISFVTSFLTLYFNLSFFHVVHTPHTGYFNHNLFFRPISKTYMMEQKNVFSIVYTNFPMIFSKIFLSQVKNNLFPGATLTDLSNILNENNIETPSEYIENQQNYISATTVYYDYFIFFPAQNIAHKIFNVIMAVIPYGLIRSVSNVISLFLKTLLIKNSDENTSSTFKTFSDLYLPYYLKKKIADDDFKIKNYNKIGIKAQNIITNYMYRHLKGESANLFNWIIQLISEFTHKIIGMTKLTAVNFLKEILDETIGDSNRKALFNKEKTAKSLRKLILDKKSERKIINYVTTFENQHNKISLLKQKKLKTKNSKTKKLIQDEIKSVIFPSLLLMGNNGTYFLYNYLSPLLNSYIPLYKVIFDCVSLKNSLKILAENPESDELNIFNIIFNILKSGKSLKLLFKNDISVKRLNYSLDLVIYPNANILMPNVNKNNILSIEKMLMVKMFKDNLYRGFNSTFILIMMDMVKNEIDVSLMAYLDFVIKPKFNIRVKNRNELLHFILTSKILKIINKSDITIKDFYKWAMTMMLKKDLDFQAFEMLFNQIVKMCNFNQMPLNLETLYLYSSTFDSMMGNI